MNRSRCHGFQVYALLRAQSCALFVFFLAVGLLPGRIDACSMSAVITQNGQSLDEFPRVGKPADFRAYNDPWDYLSFTMANSTAGSNSDGYGVVAYPLKDSGLEQRLSWYKRVSCSADFGRTYYTGSYFGDNLGPAGETEAFDEALDTIQNHGARIGIVMFHARNATSTTLGNHPFRFEYLNRSYSFMHNGYCNNARDFMINGIREMNADWFEEHPSNHFADSDPYRWVDTEVFFHYIMSFIVAREGDTLDGMQRALAKLRPYLLQTSSGVYNFVMSDGEKLYVFRSSPLSGGNSGYRLSYNGFPGKYYGIRTQTPQAGDKELRPRELVVFSENQEPVCYVDFPQYEFPDQPPPPQHALRNKLENLVTQVAISPNPSSGSAQIRIALSTVSPVETRIFNLKGEEVWHERTAEKPPGIYSFSWDGCDLQGRALTAGVYLLRINAGGITRSAKIVRINN